jgi:hypothetical protein
LISSTVFGRAQAQVGLSATVESDYRYRGYSLTDRKADLRLSATYDHPSGAYAGVSGIVGGGVGGGVRTLGYVGYLGFAARAHDGLVWDVGLTDTHLGITAPIHRAVISPQNTVVIQSLDKFYHIDYSEIYAGVTRNNLSAHLYFSPHYSSKGSKTAYLDISYAIRPVEHIRLFWHAGLLSPLGGQLRAVNRRERYDLRVGTAFEFDHGEVQLAWTQIGPRVEYPIGHLQPSNALVVSASAFY